MLFLRSYSSLVAVLLLTACIVPEPAVRPQAYDFGPPPAATGPAVAHAAVVQVMDVQAPRGMDGNYVQYRLAYADAQALKPYASSRWAMAPTQLLTQRLKQRLAMQGGVVSSGDALSALLLKTELEQFDQVFDTASASRGVVRLRATLIKDRRLLAQRTFIVTRDAPSADAQGGVQALGAASDAMLGELAAWVAEYAR